MVREVAIPRAAESETFSRNANGVRAIYVLPAFSPTPLALGLNVKDLIHGRVRYMFGTMMTHTGVRAAATLCNRKN